MRLQTRNNPDNADTNRRKENVTLRCICWNIRGWGGKQDRIKRKMSKIKSEIESFDITILTETHLSKEIGEIQKMEKTYKNLHFNMYTIDQTLVEGKE